MNTITKTALSGLAMLGFSFGAVNTADAKEPVKVAVNVSANDRTDGHYETRYETVLVEPAHYEQRYERGRLVNVWVPDRYETVAREVYVEDYGRGFGSSFRFDFGRGGHDRWDRHDSHGGHDSHGSHDSHGGHGHR